MKCEKVDLAQNGNVTSDDRISFSGTTKIEDGMVVLDAGASFAVKFRDNTTLVKVHGAVDPAYGAYDAFITMDMSGMSGMDMGMPDMSANEGFGKITGSAKRNTKSKGGLYYISTVVPNYPGHGVKVVAQGQIALVDVELCMSTYVAGDSTLWTDGANAERGWKVGGRLRLDERRQEVEPWAYYRRRGGRCRFPRSPWWPFLLLQSPQEVASGAELPLSVGLYGQHGSRGGRDVPGARHWRHQRPGRPRHPRNANN